jgi:hypothetical protein
MKIDEADDQKKNQEKEKQSVLITQIIFDKQGQAQETRGQFHDGILP